MLKTSKRQHDRTIVDRFKSGSRALLCAVAAISALSVSALAAELEAVNYDDPNLAYTNEYVGDSTQTCSKSLKGKALDLCLERTGLSKAEVTQVSALPTTR